MTYREGVNDYEYAWLLEDLIRKAEAKGVSASYEKTVLNDISRYFYNNVHWSQNDEWYLDLLDRIAKAIVDLKLKIDSK